MSVGTINFRSQIIGRPMSFNYILPDPWVVGPGPYAVFYLLHGHSDDQQTWMLNSRVVNHVAGLPLVVVMPDGERGWYCDWVNGPAYEQYLLKEVMGVVEGCFNVKRRGKARAIGGLSMGGYGAMKLGLKYPELFCSIGAHSSSMEIARVLPDWGAMKPELLATFGAAGPSNKHRAENDPFALAKKLDPTQAPAIYFDCGTEDGLVEGNRKLAKLLGKLGIKHEYQEYPGGHSWEYWDLHVQDSLARQCRALGIGK